MIRASAAASQRTKLDTDILAFLSGITGDLRLPGIHDEHVVDRHDVDTLYALAGEVGVSLNVPWDLGRASRGEGSGDEDEDVLSGKSGEVDLVLEIVDSDFYVGDSVTGLDLGGGREGGEEVVRRVGGGLEDGSHFGGGGCDKGWAGGVDLAGTGVSGLQALVGDGLDVRRPLKMQRGKAISPKPSQALKSRQYCVLP